MSPRPSPGLSRESLQASRGTGAGRPSRREPRRDRRPRGVARAGRDALFVRGAIELRVDPRGVDPRRGRRGGSRPSTQATTNPPSTATIATLLASPLSDVSCVTLAQALSVVVEPGDVDLRVSAVALDPRDGGAVLGAGGRGHGEPPTATPRGTTGRSTPVREGGRRHRGPRARQGPVVARPTVRPRRAGTGRLRPGVAVVVAFGRASVARKVLSPARAVAWTSRKAPPEAIVSTPVRRGESGGGGGATGAAKGEVRCAKSTE